MSFDRLRVGTRDGVASLVSAHRSFSQMGFTKTVAVAESQQVVVDLNHDLPHRGSHVSGQEII